MCPRKKMTVEIESGLEMLANLNNLTWLLPRKYLAVFCRRENLQEIGRGGGQVFMEKVYRSSK